MVYIFALLFILSLIAAFIGLVKPSVFQFGKPTIPSRLKVFGICLLLSLISLAMVGVYAPEVGEKPETVQTQQPVEVEKQAIKSTVVEDDFKLSVDDFRKKMNTQLKKVDVSYLPQIEQFEKDTGEVNDTIKYMFTDAVGLVGTVNKTNGNIKELTLIYGGDSDKDVVDYVVIISSIANAIAPNNTELPKRIVDLMNEALTSKKGENHSFSSQGYTFTAIASEQLGFVIVISK